MSERYVCGCQEATYIEQRLAFYTGPVFVKWVAVVRE